MLIQSGKAIYGKMPAPSNVQGFGRISMDTVLRDSSSAFNLFVSDGGTANALSTGLRRNFCFQTTGAAQPFKVRRASGMMNKLDVFFLFFIHIYRS